jgi:sugar transferase (PEP-CTERM/EpsH1 system associated)
MDVELVSLVHSAEEEGHADEMRRQGFSVTTARVSRLRNVVMGAFALLTARPLTHVLLDAPGLVNTLRRIVDERPPDVVLVYCSGMARFALEPPLRGRLFVLDMVDVDSCKWAALAATASGPKRWILAREARELARFEVVATRRAAETLVVNEREHAALAALVPSTPLRIVPNGVDVKGLRPTSPPADAPNVVFCGVMNYAPNVQAVEWFVRSAWGAVKAAHPAARLFVVGADPTASIRGLATNEASITVTGRVPDVRPYLWNAAVSIAPITTARGIQNKVIEAIAAGLPCVVTTAVMGGLPREAHAACVVGDTAETFAAAVNQLLALAPDERRTRAGRGDLSGLDWDVALAALPDLLASVVKKAPR